jgi:hypothetical protein
MANSKGQCDNVICALGSLETGHFSCIQSEENIGGFTSNQAHGPLDQGSTMYQEAVTHNSDITDRVEQMIFKSEDLKREAKSFGGDAFSSAIGGYEMCADNGNQNGLAYLVPAHTASRYDNQRLLQTARQQYRSSVVDQQQTSDFCDTSNDPTVSSVSYFQEVANASWRMGDIHNAVTSQSVQQPSFSPSWSSPNRLSPTSTTGE